MEKLNNTTSMTNSRIYILLYESILSINFLNVLDEILEDLQYNISFVRKEIIVQKDKSLYYTDKYYNLTEFLFDLIFILELKYSYKDKEDKKKYKEWISAIKSYSQYLKCINI